MLPWQEMIKVLGLAPTKAKNVCALAKVSWMIEAARCCTPSCSKTVHW